MALLRQTYAYKETRLDLDPATQGSIIFIRLPAPGAPAFTHRSPQKRSQIAEISIAEDEDSFRQKHLATAASIYNRPYHKSPRSFLWRVLEDGKVLSIQAVDLSRQDKAADANLTLRLSFPHAIKPGCIAFSDSKDHDVLSVFVLTESNHVYTLSLRPDYFRKPSSTDDNVEDWCKTYSSPSFTFKHPHRMVALSADQLLLSFYDGGLLRLERISGGDGSAWRDVHYNEGGWGQTIRSLIPYTGSNAIRYENQTVELSTATSIASPAVNLDNMDYVFTVSVDHQLRIWNLASGKIDYIGDILNQKLDPSEQAKKVIDPSQSQLVRVLSTNDESALCVTYSPLGAGEFKFWGVRPSGDAPLKVIDHFPHIKLVPQAPSSEIWTLADFSVVRDEADPDIMSLLALWKNNVTYRLLRLDFQMSSSTSALKKAWSGTWMSMATESIRESAVPTVTPGDSSDSTDKWLDFIFCPGRFTSATIETGVAIYSNRRGSGKEASRKNTSLADRMCASIASTASLDRDASGGMNYEQFRRSTNDHWSTFYRLLLELDKRRGEALSLVLDPQGQTPWVVLADGITAVRDCSQLEQIWHNNGNYTEATAYVARVLIAAAAFRDSFADQFLQSCKAMLLEELFQEPSLTTPQRMRAFWNKCDFANQVGEEEYQRLITDLELGFEGSLTSEVYSAMLQLMDSSTNFEKRTQEFRLPVFGNKLIARGVQETVELHRNICFDQLILLVFIEGELNQDDQGLHFETAHIYESLIKMIKRLELLNWLTSTMISLPIKKHERSNSVTEQLLVKKPAPTAETVTVLEGVLRHLFSLDLRPTELMSSVITEVILQICAPDGNYVAPPSVIQCFLLNNNRADLAIEFSRFCEHDAFSIYIQGRASLAVNDAVTAALLFKKAAFGLGYIDPQQRTDRRTAGYLNELERNLLNAGLPEYYSHIVDLFDKEKNYSYVVDFANLALQFIRAGPASADVKATKLRTEIHSRLFNAAIQTSRYEVAHSVLSLFTDSALQHSSLRTLVQKMCDSSYASQLVELPFLGLQEKVDEILAQKCQSIVNVNVGIPYHKILYSWRIKHSDFRGAAAISLDRLQRLQASGDGDKMISEDGLETPVTRQFIALINALSCVDPKQAWILSEALPVKQGMNGHGKKEPARKVVTLEDVRRSYQEELDRIAAIQNNQFAFGDGDAMDVL